MVTWIDDRTLSAIVAVLWAASQVAVELAQRKGLAGIWCAVISIAPLWCIAPFLGIVGGHSSWLRTASVLTPFGPLMVYLRTWLITRFPRTKARDQST